MPVVVRTVRRGVDRNNAGGARIVTVKEQQFHAGRPMGEDAEIDAVGKDGVPEARSAPCCPHRPPRVRSAYPLPNCALAAATTRSGSKPNFLWSSFNGAEAPNVFIPITEPDVPT